MPWRMFTELLGALAIKFWTEGRREKIEDSGAWKLMEHRFSHGSRIWHQDDGKGSLEGSQNPSSLLNYDISSIPPTD